MKKLLLVGALLALLPGVSFADSPLITGLDATSGQHVPFPIDHATQIPQMEISGGVPGSSGNPSYLVGQRPFAATTTITRPANTTAYTIGAVWSTATSALTAFPTFALGIGNSQRGTINNITICSTNGTATTRGQFGLFLFNTASPSGGGFNDDAAFAPTEASLAAVGNDLPGTIPSSLPMMTATPGAYCYQFTNSTGQFQTDGSGNLYAAVEVLNAYTPISGEVLSVTVSGLY